MINSDLCLHKVLYFETDRMGIVHHSNYIRWMEEGRLEYMRLNGVDYLDIENNGILMPVVSIDCKYKTSARFGDTAEIQTKLTYYNGVRMGFEYQIFMNNKTVLLCEGHSEHCFIDEASRSPVNLKKRMPDVSEHIYAVLAQKNKNK